MGATSLANVIVRAPVLAGACAEIACVSKAAAASTKTVTGPLLKCLIDLPSSNTRGQNAAANFPRNPAQNTPARNPILGGGNAKLKSFVVTNIRPGERSARVWPSGARVAFLERTSSAQVDARDAVKGVKAFVEGRDLRDVMIQHDGGVNGIAHADAARGDKKRSGAVGVGQRDRQDRRADVDEQVVHGGRQVEPFERGVAVENLLQDFGAGADVHVAAAGALEEAARPVAQRMITPGDVHRNIRVDEHHQPRPASISARTCPMSPVGAPSLASWSSGSLR